MLFNCSSDDSNDENPIPENENEYVILIPNATPLSVAEKTNNQVLLTYYDSSDNLNKICQINENGEIDWESDLQIGTNIWTSQLFIDDNNIFFFYIANGSSGVDLAKLDLDGNLVSNDFTTNQNYNNLNLRKSDNGFIAVNHESNSIQYDEYSISGSLLNSYELNYSNSQSNLSNVIRKNNITYLFRNYNINSSFFYEDFDCKIFDSNGDLSNTITLTGLEEVGKIHSSFPITSNEILMVTRENGTIGKTLNLDIFDSSGNVSSSVSYEDYGNAISLSPLSNNNICFLGQKGSSQNGKKLNFTVLNSNLEIVSEKYIGSLDNIGTFNLANFESPNFHYIYGITDSETGDFDLPNNSTSTDLFIYRLNK